MAPRRSDLILTLTVAAIVAGGVGLGVAVVKNTTFGPAPTATATANVASPLNWPVPDDKLTPGSITPGCTYPRPSSQRSVLTSTKNAAAKAYNFTGDSATVEYDHRIPFSLCGSNSLKNIWPEQYDGAPESMFIHNYKDQLELYAATEVRYHKWTLKFAQDQFKGDWRVAWCTYIHKDGVIC